VRKKVENVVKRRKYVQKQKFMFQNSQKCPKYVLDCNYIINKNVITAIMHSKPAEKQHN